MKISDWIVTLLVLSIPCVGLVMLFVWGFSGTENQSRANFCKAALIWSAILLVLAFIMLKYTKFGRSIYAIGGNEQSALMMGLNVRRVKLKAYILDGFLCGVGSVLFCLNTLGGFVEQAKGFEMDAIASSVIGGTLLTGGVGNVFGTLFGVLIKATIEAFITFQGTLSSWWTRITIAALLCFFIVLQSILAMVKKKK